jgi:hypothetical protein
MMSEKSIVENEVEQFLSQELLKPIMESLNSDQKTLLSTSLFNAFSHLIDKNLPFKPLMPEAVTSITEALKTVKVHMKDKDLRLVLNDLIEELQKSIENNDKRIYSMDCQLKKQQRAIDDQQNVINEQKNDIKRLLKNLNYNEALFLTNDLSDMYINYIFEPEYGDIKGEVLTWSDFTKQISKIEKDLHHQQLKRKLKKNPLMNDHEIEMIIDQAYSSIQQHFKVNIKDLHLLKKERTSMAHFSRRTVEEQKDLLNKVNRISMPEHFEYKDVFYNIRKELNAYTGPYHRIPS